MVKQISSIKAKVMKWIRIPRFKNFECCWIRLDTEKKKEARKITSKIHPLFHIEQIETIVLSTVLYKPINKVFLLYSCCRDKYGICIQYFWYASYSAFKFVLCLNVSWYGAFVCDLDTINQLLFTATLFQEVLEI